MILCGKCGNQNPLGRVFCGGCGAKLDLNAVTTDQVNQMSRKRQFPWHWLGYAALLLGVALLVMVALAFWPRTTPIGTEGTLVGAQRVEAAVRMLRDLRVGRTLGRDFSEEDVNGYFRFLMAKKLEFESVSVETGREHFRVRVVKAKAPITLGSVSITPKTSYDLLCIPVGGTLRVRKVGMGHLGSVGPARRSTLAKLHRRFAMEKEWKAFDGVTLIQSEPGKLRVEVTRN
jgi:hypothetical protein